MSLETFLARKYSASRGGRGLSLITIIGLIGVIVGVASLITVLAVMSGFERELRTKILGNNAHLLIQVIGAEDDPTRLDAVLREIRNQDPNSSAMAVVYGEAFLLSSSGDSEGAFIKGVDPVEVREVLDLDEYVQYKAWDDFEKGGLILGSSLGGRLAIFPGDSVTMILNRADITPFGVTPKMKRLQVVDLFHSGMSQYDAGTAYLPREQAEQIFGKRSNKIEVRAQDVREIGTLKRKLQNVLGDEVFIQDWLELNRDFLSALQVEKLVMGVILAMIMLVAALNIGGSLVMSVRDKAKDIAILKSMGASNSVVLKIFFLQGIFIGLVGTIIGALGGLILSVLLRDYIEFPLDPSVYMIDQVPVDLRISDITLVMLGAFAVSSLATLYPAWVAARMTPIEGLKVE